MFDNIRYELQAEAESGSYDTWDYEYTKEAALDWFKGICAEYPESKFRVIEANREIIAQCVITLEIK